MRDELYINGQKADISDTGITLTYQSTLFAEISKIASNYSYTIKLPKTDNNLKLIECAVYPSSGSRFPYIVHSGTVIRDGVMIVENANVVLLSVGDEIELSLTWGASTALSDMINDNASLKDLPITDTMTIGSTAYGNIVTPIIDWGVTSDAYNVFNHPAISVSTIMNKIVEKYGIGISYAQDVGNLISYLMIPLTGEDGASINDTQFRRTSMVSVNTDYVEFSNVIPVLPISTITTPYYITEVRSVGAKPQNTANIKAKDEQLDITVSVSNLTVDIQSLYAWNTYYVQLGDAKLYPESYTDLGNNVKRVVYNGTVQSTVDTNTGSYLAIIPEQQSDWTYYKVQTGTVTITPAVTYFKAGALYPYNDNLPDIKLTDLIKAIKTMYGLYVKVEGNGIKFEKYDSIYDIEDAEDWSDRLVYAVTGKCDIDFHTELAQRNTFTYKNDDVTNPANDGVILIDDMSLDEEKEAYKSVFEASENVLKSGQKVARIPIYSYDEDGNVEYNDVNPRILRRKGQIPNNVLCSFEDMSWPYLISQHYQSYINMMTDVKYVTVDMIITPIQLKELDMYKPIYLKQYGCYFAITEIKTGDNNICSVKLIKL